jgi:transcriptional regulator with XRE-family HTH domain
MPDSIDQALANALRHLRLASGDTQEYLASKAGITVAALARIERCQVSPRWTTVIRIISALGISLAELASEIEDAAV